MTSISKNAFIDKLDDIVNKYNNTFHRTIKMKPVDVKQSILTLEKHILWTYVISDLKGKEIVGIFYKWELQETNQKEFKVKNVVKRKEDKLYVKWKGYNSSFNSWIDKKNSINEWIFSTTKIFMRKSESWISFV